MQGKNTAGIVEELILPTVTELGYRLWDVTFSKVGADYHLEVTIDRDEGINIEDCEKVHRAIDPVLDEADPIEQSYYLDVSSPGIERELRKEEHFLASLGEKVEVKLYKPNENGTKTEKGMLKSYENGNLVLEAEGKEVPLEKGSYSKVHTVFFD